MARARAGLTAVDITPTMAFISRTPCAPLSPWIESLWTSDRAVGLPHAREWGLPNGRADLVVPLDRDAVWRYDDSTDLIGHACAGGVMQGVQEHANLRDTSRSSVVVGAHFTAIGLTGLFGHPAHELAGLSLPLADLWPGFTEALQAQVGRHGALHDPTRRLAFFEQALLGQWRTDTAPDAMVAWACARLARGATVGEVQRASAMSPATFITRYRAVCGLTPKRHAALMRFQTVLRLAQHPSSWAAVAADAGYADQAHLTREFQRLAGFTPGQARLNGTEFSNHLVCR